VVVTISRGRVVWENGQLSVRPGTSRFVQLPTHGPLFEGLGLRAEAARKLPYGETPVVRSAAAEGREGAGGGDEGVVKEEL